MGNSEGRAVVIVKQAFLFASGMALRIAGYALLVFVVFASMFVGFKNLDVVSAFGNGEAIVGVLLTYLALAVGFALVWLGRKASPL
jgi:hypothetical protein